jgi:hypothetical protein
MAMISAKFLLLSSMLLFTAACTTTSAPPDAPNVTTVRAADPESQRRFREALLEEQRELEAAERATAEQQALREREAAERAQAEQQALRDERENRLASETEAQARVGIAPEAEAQRLEALREYRRRNDQEESSRSADLGDDEEETSSSTNLRNAQDVARAEARVAELREQIAAYKAETTNLESTNAALREAIAAAEDLSKILAAEQEKYNSTDPATGQTVDGLAKARIEELKAQLERLKAQAAALSQPAP